MVRTEEASKPMGPTEVPEPDGKHQPDPPSVEVHQPGDPDIAGLGPRAVNEDPPDAVGGEDDRSGGPEDRAPDAPT